VHPFVPTLLLWRVLSALLCAPSPPLESSKCTPMCTLSSSGECDRSIGGRLYPVRINYRSSLCRGNRACDTGGAALVCVPLISHSSLCQGSRACDTEGQYSCVHPLSVILCCVGAVVPATRKGPHSGKQVLLLTILLNRPSLRRDNSACDTEGQHSCARPW
jgi:hypothetical protein